MRRILKDVCVHKQYMYTWMYGFETIVLFEEFWHEWDLYKGVVNLAYFDDLGSHLTPVL